MSLAREAIRSKTVKEMAKRRRKRISSKNKMYSWPVCYNIGMISMLDNDYLSLVVTMVSGSPVPGIGHFHSVH